MYNLTGADRPTALGAVYVNPGTFTIPQYTYRLAYYLTDRLAISLGGDSDTIACMAGALAEAYHGQIPAALQAEARRRLPRDFVRILDTFSAHYCLPGGGHAIT